MIGSIKKSTRLAALVLIPIILAGCGINAIPTKEQAAKTAFANVQAQYQRRSDLIPNLVSTVQGYAQQERSVLVQVTQARASATQVRIDSSTLADQQALQRYQSAQDKLTGVLGRLLAISESYPELKSNQNFLALQSQLESTENGIATARQGYNEAVRDYNITLTTFPTIFWAKTVYSGAKQMQLFAGTAAAQTAPKVDVAPPVEASAASGAPRTPAR